MKRNYLTLGLLFVGSAVFAQGHDTAMFHAPGGTYYQNTIMKELREAEAVKKPVRMIFKADPSNLDVPKDPSAYKQVWHNGPVSQGNTGTCWCFSTTSFYESEIYRLTGQKVKLSEMFTVYWEYVERAKYFVEHRGNMKFGEGSETNALARELKEYGAVPESAYEGRDTSLPFYDHSKMFGELSDYLQGVKARSAWNEDEVVSTVKSILNHYMTPPPTEVTIKGKEMTPKEYLEKVLKLDMDDYVNFMSLMQSPFYQTAEYNVGDNWWHSSDYNNIPLSEFTHAIKEAIDNGYSISIGGDVSEPGFVAKDNVAFIPDFDIPSAYIDDEAREMRFLDGSTTDDHAMHLVGYIVKDGKTWYLIKDSSSGSRTCGKSCKSFGYYYMSEDYIRLKMMTITVNKNAVKDILVKMKKV